MNPRLRKSGMGRNGTLRQEHLTSRCSQAPNFKECSWCYKNRFIDFEDFFLPEAKGEIIPIAVILMESRREIMDFPPQISAVSEASSPKFPIKPEGFWAVVSLLGVPIASSWVPLSLNGGQWKSVQKQRFSIAFF